MAEHFHKDGAVIDWHEQRGVPLSVRGPDLGRRRPYSGGKGLLFNGGNAYEQDAVTVMDNLASLFRIQDAEHEFIAKTNEADQMACYHVRLVQQYRGLRVLGGDMIVHFNHDGQAYQVNGEYIRDITIDVTPRLTASEAATLAQQDLTSGNKPVGRICTPPVLVVFAYSTEPLLAYQLKLMYDDQKAGPGRWCYWINALTGGVILRYNDIQHVMPPTANGTHVGITGSILAGEGGGEATVTGWLENTGIYYLNNTNESWLVYNAASSGSWPDIYNYAYRSVSNWLDSDRAEMSIARNAEWSQRYYREVHNRLSYNNAGAKVIFKAHYSSNYVNAYWDEPYIVIGDGDGSSASPL